MTNAGLLEKGRLAEIEAIYISLFGIAIVCWLSFWTRKKSSWLTWLLSFFFLGLGLLAKAPVHVLFFYAIVIPILWRAGEWRQLARPPHIIGVLLMLAIFAAWAVPYFHATANLNAAGVWKSQMEERVGGGDYHVGAWLANMPRGLSNFLPWLLFLPLLWSRAALANLPEREAAMIKAVRLPLLICFFALLLIPGMLPRYTLPMLVPTSVFLAMVMHARFSTRAVRWSMGAGGAAALGMAIYAIAAVPRINAAAELRPLGAQLNALVPAGEPLFIFDPGVAPVLFYVRAHCVYTEAVRDLPLEEAIVFTRRDGAAKLRKTWADAQVLGQLTDKSQNHFFVLQLRGKI
jgi:4-amino-4-deoxy-L-arabinose transferase-like glycosyltransferase